MKHFIFSLSILILLGSCKSKLRCYECDIVGSKCATCKVVKPNGDLENHSNSCFDAEEVAAGDMAFWIANFESNSQSSQGTVTCFTYDTKAYNERICLSKDDHDDILADYEDEGYTCVEINAYYK